MTCLKSKQADLQETLASQPSQESPPVQPSFTLAMPGQQFGFRVPDSNTDHFGSREHFPALSNPSQPHSSCSSSLFSGAGPSHTSTAPTSRTPSICHSSHGVEEGLSRRRSSHLYKLTLTSQSGIKAPTQISRAVVSSFAQHPSHERNPCMGEAALRVLGRQDGGSAAPHPPPPTSAAVLFDEPAVDLEMDSPPCRTSLCCTPSFYQSPHDLDKEHGILALNNVGMGTNFEIDEALLSEDEQIAKAALVMHPCIQWERLKGRVSPIQKLTLRFSIKMLKMSLLGTINATALLTFPAIHNWLLAPASATQLISNQCEATQPPEATSQSNQHVKPSQLKPQIASTTEGANPSQLQFYEPAICDIIEQAKQFSHCDTASINAFPHQVEFNKLALEYVKEATQERRTQSLFVPNGWWPQYTNDICKLGKTNNLAHPVLAGLVMDFFYGDDKSIGKQFPEVFSVEVPRVTIAIAATVLKVVLDEITSQGEVNFRVAMYLPVYLKMLGLMGKCDTSPIHSWKTKDLQCNLAETGSGGVLQGSAQSVVVVLNGFDVLLD
ncbi:hypothetical protein JVU11DRAFT_10059 [Chiua virens]|nr:hypothetical protein JVU11DRAFT_10059 [Chiua virens]